MAGYPMGSSAPPGQWQGVGYGQPAPPPSQHYGNYGQQFHGAFQANPWQGMQMSGPDELQQLFSSKVTNQSGGIQAEELCQILNQSTKIQQYYRIKWSLELCKHKGAAESSAPKEFQFESVYFLQKVHNTMKLYFRSARKNNINIIIMVAMLDRSKDGFMQYPEFEELMRCLSYWHQTFCQYDMDRSGFIEAGELGRVIKEKYGYALSPKALEALFKRYSKVMPNGQILVALDDFIALSVRLRAYTEAFRARDRQSHGNETGFCQFGYDDFIQVTMCL